jgi:hypothetical protein
MTKVLAAGKQLLDDIRQLSKPTLATAAAGLVLPILSAFGVVDLTAAEVAGDLVLAGGVAGVLEKLLGKPAPPPAPAKKSAGK